MKPNILIVEDNSSVALDMKRTLLNLGYQVSSIVSSGEDAIEKVNKAPTDLILMDIKLSGKLDGIETAAQINLNFNIPIIYLTAYSEDNLIERAKKPALSDIF